jgi:hypothetical protein
VYKEEPSKEMRYKTEESNLPGLEISATLFAQALPNTTISRSEFAPKRFAPWTDAHAASPAAIKPGITVSGLSPLISTTCYVKTTPIRRTAEVIHNHLQCLFNTNLPMVICWDPTHVVGNGRQNWNGLLGDVNTSKNSSSFRYTRKSFLENFRRQMVKMQIDVILQWP